MSSPLDVVNAAHNAFRHDIAAIDAAALGAAQGKPGLEATVERFHLFNEVLTWHASGEEAGIFPALEPVAPSVVTAYEIDHRGLDLAFDGLSKAVSAHDPLGTARATAAFKFHLDLHLFKEETHLFPIFEERLSRDDQGHAVGALGSAVPPDRFPDFVTWLFPLVDDDDREKVVRFFHMVVPPGPFEGIIRTVKSAIGDDFAELARRIPELTTT
ncbi:MAG TPA: hemerythrin domain-containing protein [Acidimicrobiales bacterium]|jgi:hypothetical protein